METLPSPTCAKWCPMKIRDIFFLRNIFGNFLHLKVKNINTGIYNNICQECLSSIFRFEVKKSEKFVTAESMGFEACRALTCPWASGLENARKGVSCDCELREFSSLYEVSNCQFLYLIRWIYDHSIILKDFSQDI